MERIPWCGADVDARTAVAALPRSRRRDLPPRGWLVDPGDLRPGRRGGPRGPDARRDDRLERPREDPAHGFGARDVPRRHRAGGHEDPHAWDVRVRALAQREEPRLRGPPGLRARGLAG